MTEQERFAIAYVRNARETATIAQFDDDHKPIGPVLRAGIVKWAAPIDGVMKLTDAGWMLLGLAGVTRR